MLTNYNLSKIAIDDLGRVTLGDDELDRLVAEECQILAGGTNQNCGGSNTSCSNNNCDGSTNAANCTNTGCDNTINGYGCHNKIRELPE